MRPVWIWWNGSVRAQARRADDLTVVVNPESECYGIAEGLRLQRRQLPDFAVRPPNYRLKLGHLERRTALKASGVENAILRKSDDDTAIIQVKGIRVMPAWQCGERSHDSILPNGAEALQVSSVLAKILAIRIRHRSLRTDHRLASGIRSVGCTVAVRARHSVQCA